MENTKNNKNTKKEKKVYTSKQLTVPGRYILDCMADDKTIKYPITLYIRTKLGGATLMLHDAAETKSMENSPDVKASSLFSLMRDRKGWYVGMEKDGKFTVKNEILPQRHHGDVLFKEQVREMYRQLVHPAPKREGDAV